MILNACFSTAWSQERWQAGARAQRGEQHFIRLRQKALYEVRSSGCQGRTLHDRGCPVGDWLWGQLGNVNLLFSIIFEVSIGQKVNMLSAVSKILNFHPIDLKFEEGFQIRSLNSSTNFFWGYHRPKYQHRPKFIYLYFQLMIWFFFFLNRKLCWRSEMIGIVSPILSLYEWFFALRHTPAYRFSFNKGWQVWKHRDDNL